MELRDSDKTTVNLIPGNISMVGDTVLVQYIVENWSLEHRDKGNINTRISRRVTIVTQCHNCDALCHNCDILFVKMLELGSEIIPKN